MPKYPNVEVDLSEEDGNAFFIIARTSKALRRAGVEADEVKQYKTEAQSGDYDNVLQTTMKWVATF